MIQIRYNLLYAALAKGNMKQNNTKKKRETNKQNVGTQKLSLMPSEAAVDRYGAFNITFEWANNNNNKKVETCAIFQRTKQRPSILNEKSWYSCEQCTLLCHTITPEIIANKIEIKYGKRKKKLWKRTDVPVLIVFCILFFDFQ